MSIRVDTAPLALQPLLALYGYALGYTLFAYYAVQRITLAIEFAGTDNLTPESNYIFCHWHGAVPLALQCSVPHLPSPLTGHSHVWMSSSRILYRGFAGWPGRSPPNAEARSASSSCREWGSDCSVTA